MATLVLLEAEQFRAELLMDPRAEEWQPTALRLSRGASDAEFGLIRPPPVPQALLVQVGLDRWRLKTLQEAGEAAGAQLRDWLHHAGRLSVDMQAAGGAWFFGSRPFDVATIQGQARAHVDVDLSAWLDPREAGVAYATRARISVQAQADVEFVTDFEGFQRTFVGQWQLGAVFSWTAAGLITAELDLQLPIPGIRLPRVAFPDLSFNAPLSWPSLPSVDIRCPEWLQALVSTFAVEFDNPEPLTLHAVNDQLTLRGAVERIRVVHAPGTANSATWLTAHDVTLALNADNGSGGVETRVRCRSIEAPSFSLGRGRAPPVFGLPVSLVWRDVVVRTSLELLGPQPALKFSVDVLGLSVVVTDDPDTFITLDVKDIVIIDGRLQGSPRLLITEGGVSHALMLEVREAIVSAGQVLKRVFEVSVRAARNIGKAFGALLRWLAKLFSGLALPSTGPVNVAWPAVGEWLSGLADALSVQLVFDAENRRLLRVVISGSDAPGADGSRRLLDALGFTLDATYQAGQLAVVVETAGPPAGDWFVLVVPPAGTAGNWLTLTLASDLWLTRAGGTELAQDADPASGKPTEPALTVKWSYPAAHALAVAGLQHGKPRFFREFITTSGEELISLDSAGAPEVRVIEASGSYALGKVDLAGDIEVAFNPDRVLPFLRKLKSGGGSGAASQLQQYLTFRIKKQTIDKRSVRILGTLTLNFLGKAGGLVLDADVEAELDLDTLQLRLQSDGVEFKTDKSALELKGLLGLDWKFTNPKVENGKSWTIFRLSLEEDPVLSLGEGAVLSLSFTALDPDQPLTFEVSKFALSRGGISLDARAKNSAPIRLGGIDTYFQFEQAELRLRDSVLEDFQLAGTGSLPPALVGDAKVNASLHFGMKDGNIVVHKAYAQLDKSGDPIECKALRFQFVITALGFDFVRTGTRYDFYFLVSGSAEFKPEGNEFSDGLLKYLRNVKVELNQCPLTSDPSVLARHLTFTMPTPQPKIINFFDLFKFEIRSIGFEPASKAFNGAPALKIGGQIDFAEIGDVVDPDISFHALYIGPPKPGKSMPQLRCDGLRLRLKIAGKVKVGGALAAVDGELPTLFRPAGLPEGVTARGFLGDGELEIPGLPGFSASFGFMQITRPDGRKFRAWFVFLQADKLTYQIKGVPLPLFIRRLGFGLGYRYTLVGIKAAEEATSPQALIAAMDEISKRQGELARFEAWEPEVAEEAKFTLALAGMVAMATSSPDGAHEWDESVESNAPNPILFDLIAALRSDFTFLMNLRVWLAVNYADYLNGNDSLRHHPLVTGYLYLSAPRQEFLARLVSHPDGYIGEHPVVPDLVKRALTNIRFSATLLMRPGLLHFELGWPNQLSWQDRFGPLDVRCEGGFVFRVEDAQLLLGMNFSASGRLELRAEAGSSSFGASIAALAHVAFLARIIALIDARRTKGSMYYGLVALDLNVEFRVRAWLSFKVFDRRISITVGFSFGLQISVALELVLTGDPAIAGRARAYVAIRAFGRALGLRVNLAYNATKVDEARARVARFLDIGLAGPAKLPPDPFGQAAKRTARTLSARTQADEPAVTAAAVFNAWCMAPQRLPQRLPDNLQERDLALVVLVPHGNDFYLPEDSTYALGGMLQGSLRFDATSGAWLAADQANFSSTFFSSNFTSVYAADAGDQLTLGQYLKQAYREDGSPPFPRVWGARQRLDGVDPDARGRRLYDAERATHTVDGAEDVPIHDARDFLLAQFLDDLKRYAEQPEHPGTRAHVLQTGLVLLVPVRALDEWDRLNVTLTTKVRDATSLTAPVTLINPPKHKWFRSRSPHFASLETRNDQDRVLFAWDLEWEARPGVPSDDEPEDVLLGYEIRRRIDDADGVEGVWQVMPCDTAGATADGRQWESFRNVFQFSDDFSDAGLDEALRQQLRSRTKRAVLRYVITPICQALTRGPAVHVTVVREARQSMPAPHAAAVTWRWGESLDAPVLQDARLETQWNAPGLAVRLAARPKPHLLRVVLRAERLRIGGSYGADAELETRDSLGVASAQPRNDDWMGTIPLSMSQVTQAADAPGEAAVGTSLLSLTLTRPGEAARPLREVLQRDAGRSAWRVFVQLVDPEGADAPGLLLEASHEVRGRDEVSTGFTMAREFEWLLPASAPPTATMRAAVGAVGQLEPGDDLAALGAAAGGWEVGEAQPDLGVMYELRWPLSLPRRSAPEAGFALEFLELDEVPPRLLDPKRQLRVDGRELRRELESVAVVHPDRLALTPEHNRDGAQWEAVYPSQRRGRPVEALSGPGRRGPLHVERDDVRVLEWPARPCPLVLATVPEGLLDYLENAWQKGGDPQWPTVIYARLLKGKEPHGTLELLDPRARALLQPTQNAPGVVALDPGALGAPSVGTRAQLRAALSSLAVTGVQTLPVEAVVQILAGTPEVEIVDFGTAYAVPRASAPRLHPLLQWFATALQSGHLLEAGTAGTPWWRVEFQSSADAPSVDVGSWVTANGEGADPYGWRALRDVGLAMTLRVFDRALNQYLHSDELVAAVNRTHRALQAAPQLAQLDAEFLFIDVLLKPQRLYQRRDFEDLSRLPGPSVDEAGLAMIQVTLRPRTSTDGAAAQDELASFRAAVSRLGWHVEDALHAADLKAMGERFHRHARAPRLMPAEILPYALAAPRINNPVTVSPDVEGYLAYTWRDKDRYGHQRAFRAVPVGRYDTLLQQIYKPIAPPHSALNPPWVALDTPRTEPVAAPAVLQSRWLSVPSEQPCGTPLWQVVVGRHAEQALSEANGVLQSRLRFAGQARSLVRQPADRLWVDIVAHELNVTILSSEVEPDTVDEGAFEARWREREIRDADWGALRPTLWRGATVLRYPALPYCYRHDLALVARAGVCVSSIQIASTPALDIEFGTHGQTQAHMAVADAEGLGRGGWLLMLEPTRYRDLMDAVTRRVWECEANDGSPRVRDLPDPEVAYQFDLVAGDMREPIVHVVRNRQATPALSVRPAYVGLPLGRRFAVDTALRLTQVEAEALPLELEVSLRVSSRAPLTPIPIAALPDHITVEAGRRDLPALVIRGGLDEADWSAVLTAFAPNDRRLAEDALVQAAMPWNTDVEATPLAGAGAPPAWLLPVAEWTITVHSEFTLQAWETLAREWQDQVGWRSAPLRRVLGEAPPFPAPGAPSLVHLVSAVDFAVEQQPLPGLTLARVVRGDRFRVLGFLDETRRDALRAYFGPDAAGNVIARFDQRLIGVRETWEFQVSRFRGALPQGEV